MKKQYNKPSMEVVEIKSNQQLLAGSGDKIYGDDPQLPGSAMTPEFQEMQSLLFGE